MQGDGPSRRETVPGARSACTRALFGRPPLSWLTNEAGPARSRPLKVVGHPRDAPEANRGAVDPGRPASPPKQRSLQSRRVRVYQAECATSSRRARPSESISGFPMRGPPASSRRAAPVALTIEHTADTRFDRQIAKVTVVTALKVAVLAHVEEVGRVGATAGVMGLDWVAVLPAAFASLPGFAGRPRAGPRVSAGCLVVAALVAHSAGHLRRNGEERLPFRRAHDLAHARLLAEGRGAAIDKDRIGRTF